MKIGLQDAITALRQELTESILSGASQDLRFEIGQIIMEFQVEIEQAHEASGKINIWVVDVGGGTARRTTKTHTITIPLRPVSSQGRPILTGGDIIPE